MPAAVAVYALCVAPGMVVALRNHWYASPGPVLTFSCELPGAQKPSGVLFQMVAAGFVEATTTAAAEVAEHPNEVTTTV